MKCNCKVPTFRQTCGYSEYLYQSLQGTLNPSWGLAQFLYNWSELYRKARFKWRIIHLNLYQNNTYGYYTFTGHSYNFLLGLLCNATNAKTFAFFLTVGRRLIGGIKTLVFNQAAMTDNLWNFAADLWHNSDTLTYKVTNHTAGSSFQFTTTVVVLLH